MSDEADKRLLDELDSLLTAQIMLARRDRFADVEMGCRKVGALLDQITRTGALEKARFAAERERVTGLYSDLCLILAARKAALRRRAEPDASAEERSCGAMRQHSALVSSAKNFGSNA